MKTVKKMHDSHTMGKLQIQRPTYGVVVARDVFQACLSQLLQDLPFVLVYIDNIFIIGANSFADHLD